jgi:hypothetical protein
MTPADDPADPPAAEDPVEQLRETIEVALKAIDELTANAFRLYSVAAVELLVGTALKESGGLRWRRQLNQGPARGLFQMEGATYADIWRNYLAFRPALAEAIRSAFTPAGGELTFDQITDDDAYAAVMARLHYLRVPAPLPPAGDVQAQAMYWKQHYNTKLGKGTVASYVETWTKYTA